MTRVIWKSAERDRRAAPAPSARDAVSRPVVQPPMLAPTVAAAEGRQPAQPHREDEISRMPIRKVGRRHADQRDGHASPRRSTCRAAAPLDAERDADGERHERRDGASSSVAGRRSAIRVETGRARRSSCRNCRGTALARKRTNWTSNGLVQPEVARISGAVGRRRLRPSMLFTGSPTKLNSEKADERHRQHDGEHDCRSREMMKASMACECRPGPWCQPRSLASLHLSSI